MATKTHMYDPKKEQLEQELADGCWNMFVALSEEYAGGELVFDHEDGDCQHRYPFVYRMIPGEAQTAVSPEYAPDLGSWDFENQENNYPLFTHFIPHFGGMDAVEKMIEKELGL